MRGSLDLFRDPYFMGLTFIGGFGMASFFVFIASASFVYTDHYGLTPTQFSLAFAVNAIGFFTASQIRGRPRRTLRHDAGDAARRRSGLLSAPWRCWRLRS